MEDLRFFFLICKLTSDFATCASRKYETPESVARDFLTHGVVDNASFMLTLVFLVPKSHRVMLSSSYIPQMRNCKLRKPKKSKGADRKCAQHLP